MIHSKRQHPRRSDTAILVIDDRYSGQRMELVVRNEIVVGACGCEPSRYLGLNLSFALRYARFGGAR